MQRELFRDNSLFPSSRPFYHLAIRRMSSQGISMGGDAYVGMVGTVALRRWGT